MTIFLVYANIEMPMYERSLMIISGTHLDSKKKLTIHLTSHLNEYLVEQLVIRDCSFSMQFGNEQTDYSEEIQRGICATTK